MHVWHVLHSAVLKQTNTTGTAQVHAVAYGAEDYCGVYMDIRALTSARPVLREAASMAIDELWLLVPCSWWTIGGVSAIL